jgi:hypothetical protein
MNNAEELSGIFESVIKEGRIHAGQLQNRLRREEKVVNKAILVGSLVFFLIMPLYLVCLFIPPPMEPYVVLFLFCG